MMKNSLISPESENSVIGALLLDNASYDKVSDLLSANDFHATSNQVIFREITKFALDGDSFDVVTLEQSLRDSGNIDRAGGLSNLANIVKNTPTSANIYSYAKIVQRKAKLRRLQQALRESNELLSTNQDQNSDELLDTIEQKILAIKDESTNEQSDICYASEVLYDVVDHLDKITENKSGITGIPTGYIDLDKKLSGMHEAELIIVAGRPSMGKTTFALNILENVLMDTDSSALFFSLEMPKKDIMLKICSSHSKVHFEKLRAKGLDDDDWSKFTVSMATLKNSKLGIVDTPSLTPMQVKHRARKFKRENPDLGLIVVDYLQLMRVPGYENNRTQEVSEISRSLKSLAKELNIPVIAISQLNRAVDDRRDKRPLMSDLRESGAIEQDADVIMFVYRHEVYEPLNNESKGKAEVIISKQRNGPIGSINLVFKGEISRFETMVLGTHQNFLSRRSNSDSYV
jgi:replicative DNA helicase